MLHPCAKFQTFFPSKQTIKMDIKYNLFSTERDCFVSISSEDSIIGIDSIGKKTYNWIPTRNLQIMKIVGESSVRIGGHSISLKSSQNNFELQKYENRFKIPTLFAIPTMV